MTVVVLSAIELVLLETVTHSQRLNAAHHPLLLEWDTERNVKDGIHSQTLTFGSKKLVHWVCHNCPKGEVHLYQMMPKNRTGKRASGCPYCANKQGVQMQLSGSLSPRNLIRVGH